MKASTKQAFRFFLITALCVPFEAALAQGNTATHACDGYTASETLTINCQASYSGTLAQFLWEVALPDNWTVVDVNGGGGGSWEIISFSGLWYLSPGETPTQNPMSFTVTVSKPAGQTGTKNVSAVAYFYNNDGETSVVATPDPLVLERLCTLQVLSDYGTATPSVGMHTNLYGTVLNPSVTDSVYLGTTQYMCAGWAMTGNTPASGSTNSFTMTVTADAVLTWNWSLYNVAPVITNTVSMLALRTKPSTITEAALLVPAYDPLDTLTVTAVSTTSTKGATITWSGGILGYTPPATNRLGFTENIPYTVQDGHGAEATGTLTVTVPPAGTAIRVF